MNRRGFLMSAGVAAAAAATIRAEPEQSLQIVDTHEHLWDLSKFRLPWLTKGSPLDRSYLPSDYAEAIKGLNVTKSVYMEVDVDPSQQDAEADYVIELIKSRKTPMVAAVISGRPESENFAKYMARFKNSPYVKGVRRVLHAREVKRGTCLEKTFVANIRLLGEMGMSFDLCMRSPELPDAASLVDACPQTRFILDHCGNPNLQSPDLSSWKQDILELAKRKNLVCKVSGILATAKPYKWTPEDVRPVINHVLDSFGPERVLFAADWPVCTVAGTFKQWVDAVKTVVADRPLAAQRKLFHDNAVRFYGLS